ncbi:MAG: hypothetical protein KA885_02980 [Spirochaetes bacterium]|nr:hypothetical protein [Spirochaetota bacterium]
MKYTNITDISILSSLGRAKEEYLTLLNTGIFENPNLWNKYKPTGDIPGLADGINSRMKYSMSKLSLGVYNVLESGPYKSITQNDEIYEFSGFTEIETVGKIGKLIMIENYGINPALFPNSVQHTALCYFSILKKISNYTAAINDGPSTNASFINFIQNRVQIPGAFIIVAGEESSDYFSYDADKTLDIVPAFIAFKCASSDKKGFAYLGAFAKLSDIYKLNQYKKAEYIFLDKESFFSIERSSTKRYFTEYALTRDNPTGIIARLALPFYFEFDGPSLVIENIRGAYYIFSVNL